MQWYGTLRPAMRNLYQTIMDEVPCHSTPSA